MADRTEDIIRSTATEYMRATNRGGRPGAQGYASYTTEDALWLPPDSPTIKGRKGVEDWVFAYTDAPGFEVSWEHPHVVVADSEDIAYSVGTYRGAGQDPDGDPIEFVGKFINVWHKQDDGSWKIAVAVWNTNEPGAPT